MTSSTLPSNRTRPGPRRAPRDVRLAKPEPRPARGRHRPVEIDDETWQSRIAWRWWFIGALLALIIAIVALLRAPFFAISDVQLTGEARTSEGTILDVLAIAEGQALASYDVSGAEAEIALLPWVEQVEVTRSWPSTLRVQIRERVPAAAITSAAGREWVVVSNDGHVLERRLTPPSKVPLIVAARAIVENVEIGEIADEALRPISVATNLPTQLLPWVDSWTVDATGLVNAELVGSARALFGSETDNRTQFVSLASILSGGASLVCISEIDLTIGDTPVVHRNEACLRASSGL